MFSILLIVNILSVVVVGTEFNSTEECRSKVSKGIHPICNIPADYFKTKCISERVMYLLTRGSGSNTNRTIFCSANYPIEIVLNFRERSLIDVSLDFPEFERTVEDISKLDTYVYYIRIPFGFITRSNSDVKSFTIRSVNTTSISTSFVNYNHDFRRHKELERSQRMERVIHVTQELIKLPCPIYERGVYPDGVHRIQSNSTGATAKRSLVDILSDGPSSRPNGGWTHDEIKELQVLFDLNNIPVDNKRLLWDPINGFRFNISNWPSKEYLGSYFCTSGGLDDMFVAKNFTLVNWKGYFGKPDYDDIYIATIARTVDVLFECVSTNEIRFYGSFQDGLLNNATVTILKSPESVQSTIFHLVYHVIISTWGNGTKDGTVQCIDIRSRKPLRTWSVGVRDVRFQATSEPTFKNTIFSFRLGSDAALARCNSWGLSSGRSVKYLTCRNVMECEMIKFCIQENASCPNFVGFKQCEIYEDCIDFKPPDNGILRCHVHIDTSVTYFKGFDGLIYADWIDAPIDAVIQLEMGIPGKSKWYSQDWLSVSCKGHRMLTGGLIQWILQFKNNTWSHIQGFGRNNSDVIVKSENLLDGIKNTLHVFITTPDVVGITCMVPVWNSDQWLNMSQLLHIIEPSKPEIITGGSYKYFKIGSHDQSVSCLVLSDPASELTWMKLESNTPPSFTITHQINFASLHFPKFSSSDVGDYKCTASNIAGNDSKIFHVSIEEAGTGSNWLYIVVAILLILLGIGSIVIFWIRRNLQIARRSDAETQMKESVDKFLNGYEDEDSNADRYPYNNEFEIPMENLTIDRTKVLGSGAFGVVYRGRMEGRAGTVAIKTLQQMPRYNVEYFQALMSELKLLIFIGKHLNIVELVGAVTCNIHSGEFYIVSEECVVGSIQNYLRSKRSPLTCGTSVRYLDLTTDDWKVEQQRELSEYLMKWSYQVADAMEFISAKNVIHADLATRNILLTGGHDAKITDFGLSRKLYNYVQYVKKKMEPLPWAWMSIEALRDLTFSTKSDVWSYGVVLWEMYSFAAVPYGGMNYDTAFIQKLKEGFRLPKPELATDSIYALMQTCWSIEPRDRPSFSDLKRCHESIQEGIGCSVSHVRT